jgi:TonB family protein
MAFSRFQIMGEAGHGVTGWVLQTRDLVNGKEVALKLISPTLLHTDAERAQFQSAFERAANIRHANLVEIFGVQSEEGQLFYLAPYLQGLTLRKIIDLRLEKGEVFSLAEMLPILSQLADAVDFFGRVMVHGALRPSNVTVLTDSLKITGLPHLQGLPRRPLIMLLNERGEADYVAPEATREDTQLRPAADVYSLAVLAGEMLSGVRCGRDIERWDEVQDRLSPRVLTALIQGWAEAPEERFATARAFYEALHATVGEAKAQKARAPVAVESKPPAEEPQPLAPPSLQEDLEPSEPVLPAPADHEDAGLPSVDLEPPSLLSRLEREEASRVERGRRSWRIGSRRLWLTAAAAAAIVTIGVVVWAVLEGRGRPNLGNQPPVPNPPVASAEVPPVAAGEEQVPPATDLAQAHTSEAPETRPPTSSQTNLPKRNTAAVATGRNPRGKTEKAAGSRENPTEPHVESAPAAAAQAREPPWVKLAAQIDLESAAQSRQKTDGSNETLANVIEKATLQDVEEVRRHRIEGVDPPYPRSALDREQEGVVVARVTVGVDGRVIDIKFIQSNPVFERTVRSSVARWKFRPFVIDGQPAAVYTVFHFVFKLS